MHECALREGVELFWFGTRGGRPRIGLICVCLETKAIGNTKGRLLQFLVTRGINCSEFFDQYKNAIARQF